MTILKKIKVLSIVLIAATIIGAGLDLGFKRTNHIGIGLIVLYATEWGLTLLTGTETVDWPDDCCTDIRPGQKDEGRPGIYGLGL